MNERCMDGPWRKSWRGALILGNYEWPGYWHLCTPLWSRGRLWAQHLRALQFPCQGNASRWGLHRVGAHWQKVCMLGSVPTHRRCNMGLPYWPGRDHTTAKTPCS